MNSPAVITNAAPSTDSSDPVNSEAASAAAEPTTADVAPPAYMSTPAFLQNQSPNYSDIAASQTSDSNALSTEVARSGETLDSADPQPADQDPANADSAAEEQTEEEAQDDTENPTEETDSEEESSEETEEESASEEGEEAGAEEASAESGETQEEQGAEEGEEDSLDGDSASVALGPAGGAANSDDDEDMEVLVAKLPSMAPIRPPFVGNPPTQAIQRRDDIIKRTGSPPEQHHAQVRQAAERVTQAARDAQRRMLWTISNISRDTRISIEDMADEVLKATGGAVAQVEAAIKAAQVDIGKAAADRIGYLEGCTLLTGEALEANRDATTQQVVADLRAGSENVKKLEEQAKSAYEGYMSTAQGFITSLPSTGKAARLPPLPNAKPPKNPPPPPKEPSYKVIASATSELNSFIDKKSGVVGSEGSNSKTYYLGRATPMVTGYSDREATAVTEQANKASKDLSSETNRSQFMLMLLGLTTPVSEDYKDQETQAEKDQEKENLKQMTALQAAHYIAKKTLNQKSTQASQYAGNDLRKNLTDNLWKSGRKAAKNLRKQASSSETNLINTAVPMAAAYRDLVTRLNALLPPNQFLDSRQIVPQLLVARDNARRLQLQHEGMIKEQAKLTLDQSDENKKEQIEGLYKSAQDSRQSITDVVTQTSFDMEVYVMQVSGSSRAGAGDCMQAASKYADRTAKGILDSVQGVEGPGMDRIKGTAIGFFNGAINNAEQTQYMQLEAFVKGLEKDAEESGPLTKPMFDAKKDISDRTTAIDNAMPEPLTGGEIAAGGAAVLLCPILAIPAAVAVYENDPSENKVVGQLAGVMWPGILALEEYFNAHHSDLRQRIKDRLSEPGKSDALGLFSDGGGDAEKGAKQRADVRNRIINDSTHWYSDYNRDTREAAAGYMSGAERNQLSADQIRDTTENITSNLNANQSEIVQSYIAGNRQRAVAARTREALDDGAKEGAWGWIFSAEEAQRRSDQARVDAIAKMDKNLRDELARENAFATVMTTKELMADTDKVYIEFGLLNDPLHRSAKDFSQDQQANLARQGRSAVINYASQAHQSAVLGVSPLSLLVGMPVITADVQTIQMSKGAKDYITAMVENDGSDEAADKITEARGIFEIKRADNEHLGLSETTQGRLSDALENRKLAQLERAVKEAKNPQEKERAQQELDKERQRHQGRMMAMARGLDAPPEIANDPARAEAWMRERVGNLFARTDTIAYRLGIGEGESHYRYGDEMMQHGRASLDASVALAADGLGTNEELLKRSYQDRSKQEIAAANARWAEEHHGEDMEQMLGIKKRDLTSTDYLMMAASPMAWLAVRGAETSGDLAMDLELLAQGNPENDQDKIKLANMRYDQQRVRGTGFIADHTMQGTDEQRCLDSSRVEMARTILDEAVKHNPELKARYGDNPLAIFGPDGGLNSDISDAAFKDGNFLGDSTLLANRSEEIGYAAEAYKAEIDRQEAIITTSITILALVASIALMVIPGVNVVAAGIAVAIIAGAATVIAKAGMRGERYGWEEAATDVASAAIEAATAGVGGALSGGLGAANKLAKVGVAMEKALGSKLAAAVVREAIVHAVSSAASTAIQDETWKDGLGSGLGKVANGAIRGAVVAAISTGISQGLTNKLNAKMNLENLEPGKMSQWQKMATRLGPHASEMFREGLTNGLGALASEAVGVGIDYAQGNFHGGFSDALKQIGMATLRETISGAARGGVMSMNRANYRQLLEAARNGAELGPKEMRALRLFAISAGALNYDSSPADMHHEVQSAKSLLAQLPPGLREHASALDLNALHGLVGMLSEGSLGELSNPHKRAEYLVGLAESVPGLNAHGLMEELNAAIAKRAPAGVDVAIEPEQQQQLRSQLGANLHENVKFALEEVRLDGLQHLNEAELSHAAAMIASGEFNSATADHLMRAAKTRNPQLDEFAFLSNLHNAVSTTKQVQETLLNMAVKQRQQVVALVPKEAAPVFAQLGNAEVELAQKLIRSGNPGTPQEQDSLFHAARLANPELTRDEFHGFMQSAATKVREQMASESQVRRTAREERMTHVPEELRGTLSALPEAALVELRLRQMSGELSPAEKNRLLVMAERETPGVDPHILGQALEQAVKHPPEQLATEAQTADMRKHLLSAIPAEQQALIAQTKILVVPAEEFAAMTRSQKGQAVTLLINGEAVVVVREGANPRVLREEGIHALQAQDPRWAKHIGSLDEYTMAQWDSLPLEQQIVLYRNKLALEVDAQAQVIRSLEMDIANAKTPGQKTELEEQLVKVKGALENLSRRQLEVGQIDTLGIANIKAGFSERPEWLDQPARLFSKDSTAKGDKSSEEPARQLTPLQKKLMASLPQEQQAHLHSLPEAQHITVLNMIEHMAEQGLPFLHFVQKFNLEQLSALVELAPRIKELIAISKSSNAGDKSIDASEIFHLVNMTAQFNKNLPENIKSNIKRELFSADVEQLRKILPFTDVVLQLAKTRNTEGKITGEMAVAYLQGLKRVASVKAADLHVHTTSLVDAADITHWVGENLGSLNKKGLATLQKALLTLAIEGTDLSILKQTLQDWHTAVRSGAPEAKALGEMFGAELQKQMAMSVNESQQSAKLLEFFAQFQRLKSFVSGKGAIQLRILMQSAIERSFGNGTGWLELRGQHTGLLKNSTRIQELLTLAGGVIATVARGKLSTTSFVNTLKNAINRNLFLGFDISGQETETLRGRLKKVVDMSQVVAEHNSDVIGKFLTEQGLHEEVFKNIQLDAALHAQQQAREHPNEPSVIVKQTIASIAAESQFEIPTSRKSGTKTVEISAAEQHQLLVEHLQTKINEAEKALNAINAKNKRNKGQIDTTPATDELLHAVGLLNRYNKVLTEALQRMDVLPHPSNAKNNKPLDIIGLTIHAGEQVGRKVEGKTPVLARLMDDMELAIRAGTDRIGHGVILGLSFDASNPAALRKTMEDVLGFQRVDKKGVKVWVRGGEVYTDQELANLESRRKAALKQVAHQGITLEVPPTSNIILNNLGLEEHPVLRMLQDAPTPPGIKISVATDNPGVHAINAHSELALLLSMGLSWPNAVNIILEGFTSRMGARPIGGEDNERGIRQSMVAGIAKATPPSEYLNVLSALAKRYPEVIAARGIPLPEHIENEEKFKEWIRLFVKASMGSIKPGTSNKI